jgi:hypothetical protein
VCAAILARVLRRGCDGLPDLERGICVYEVAATTGNLRGCGLIDDPDLANDCRAVISGRPSYCASITDAARRSSCCEAFRDTGGFDACLDQAGPAEPAPPAAEEPTAAPAPAPPAATPGGSDPGDAVAGSEPPWVTSPDFAASYTCSWSGQSGDEPLSYELGIEFSSSAGVLYWQSPDFGQPPGANDPFDDFGGIEVGFYERERMFAPHIWLPLDGTAVTVWDAWTAPDTDPTERTRSESWSEAVFTPGPTIPAVQGLTPELVPYTAVLVREIRTIGMVERFERIEYRVWLEYDAASGMLYTSQYEADRTIDQSTDSNHQPELGVIESQRCELGSSTAVDPGF